MGWCCGRCVRRRRRFWGCVVRMVGVGVVVGIGARRKRRGGAWRGGLRRRSRGGGLGVLRWGRLRGRGGGRCGRVVGCGCGCEGRCWVGFGFGLGGGRRSRGFGGGLEGLGSRLPCWMGSLSAFGHRKKLLSCSQKS